MMVLVSVVRSVAGSARTGELGIDRT